MEGELAKGSLGSVGKYDMAFKGGQLVVELDAGVSFGSAGLVLKLDAAAVIDALAGAIPGSIDDAVFGVVKAALLSK
jgi:hypothetical protein